MSFNLIIFLHETFKRVHSLNKKKNLKKNSKKLIEY